MACLLVNNLPDLEHDAIHVFFYFLISESDHPDAMVTKEGSPLGILVLRLITVMDASVNLYA